MTITYDWRIANLEHEVSDGFVFTAHWTVTALDSEINPKDPEGGFYSAGAYGSLNFNRPDYLIPYDSLTEATVIGWVKEQLGAEQVSAIQERLLSKISEAKNPSTANGTPW